MKNKNYYAVLLVGGSGTRFWPMSRKSKPKQFLDITGNGTLFEQTIRRIKPVFDGKNIFIVTNKNYKKDVTATLKKCSVPVSNILYEPQAKNTAPAVCWAAAKIHKINPNAIMAVLPSDHLISKQDKFLKVLNQAFQGAQDEHLMTLGIVPTRPETGYGYLKTKNKKSKGKNILAVEKFTEKPNVTKAKQFLKNKNYFWNSGMFVWKTSVILGEFKKYLPQIYQRLALNPSQKNINKIWKGIKPISIDYGILEKALDVAAVAAPGIGWSDLGSWEALTDVLAKDKKGNILKGDTLSIDCKNTLVFPKNKLIATIGLDDIIVVETDDALLVCRKELSQKVKDVVEVLKGKKSNLI